MEPVNTSSIKNESLVNSLPGFSSNFVAVNGINFHYVRGGAGLPLILLPGWPLTWWSYHKIMPVLAEYYDVIVVDYRGMGSSDKPVDGYDKKNMASDISELVKELGLGPVHIAGHDIGAMIAFSFAANHPDQTAKLILLDANHPEESMYQLTLIPPYGGFDGERLSIDTPYFWWWSFFQVKGLSEQLMEGRAHFIFEWFFQNSLVDQNSISSFDRSVYFSAYQTKDDIRAANAWFQNFARDIEDQKSYAPLELPVLGIAGAFYDWMGAVLPAKVKNLKMVKATKTAHYPAQEEPEFTAQTIIDFIATK
ncbi:pimeloyl-ACP methyl ester carboxylesterase [Pedobacter cryoconitis]|uniref:alpha/beta fold hydrolase n=1 Tax=Pedobacter cryoconitis TaxID=188932 RepID=UPI00160CAC9D|nr:alpha/beta hydrolase [Pedobacter cryoconitis]MBB6270956.1 pimeloyl-ACP methyl ester carboxylesterase [Pedobacter cryoconitis]